MQALRLVDIGKSYEGVVAVRGVSVTFVTGEIHAVVANQRKTISTRQCPQAKTESVLIAGGHFFVAELNGGCPATDRGRDHIQLIAAPG